MNQALQTLAKYAEFQALKHEFLKYIEALTEELKNLDTKDPTFHFQAGIKIESIKAVEGLLTKLGLITQEDFTKKKQTYE
jgi:hypothetical protein